MRCVGGLFALVISAAFAATVSARAEEACTRPDALGVGRVIEIDTTGGPKFGEPFGDPNFLAPGEVVLTFDDGPMPASTRAILAALKAECTKATFFVVGSMAAAHPEVVREVAAQGHTIGTHTWSHANLRALPESSMQAQIESAFTAVEKAAGGPIAPFFRYPYLANSHASWLYLKRRDIAQFDVDVDSSDWLLRNAPRVIQRVMTRLEARGRGIILLHDIHASTALAVPGLLSRLKANGYKVVHLQPKTHAQTLVAFAGTGKEAGPDRTRWRRTVTVKSQAKETAAEAKAPQPSPFFKWPPW